MNLRDRIGKWVLLLIMPFFLMCEDPNEIGAELNPNDDNLNVLYREFDLSSSVVFSDSVDTTNPTRFLFGRYDDPAFGQVTATTYTQLGIYEGALRPPSPIEPDAVFDSAFIYLHLDYFYGENFQEPQHFRVLELSDTLFSGVTYKSTLKTKFVSLRPIAETERRLTPGTDSLIVLRVDERFAKRVMDITILEQPTSSSNRAITQEIKGIALVPEDDMDFIIGVNTTVQGDSLKPEEESAFRIYYHRTSVPDLVKFFDFTLKGNASYIGVEADRSGTVLNNATQPFQDFLPGDGMRYVQPGSGIYTKIDMGPVRDFIDSLNGFLVNQVLFEIGSVMERGSSEDYLQPIGLFNLAFTNNTNKVSGFRFTRDPFNSLVMADDGYFAQSNQVPLNFELNKSQRVFQTDRMSNFMQVMADRNIEQPDLMIYPPDFSTMDQLIFDANSIKLKIFYTTLQ